MLILNVIVLIFEVLYYSLFMYYSKNEGKLSRYILLFSLITIIMLIFGTNKIYSYLIFILGSLYGLKNIIKIKTSLYDMLVIILMLFSKLIIELPICLVIYIFIKNIFIVSIIVGIIKLIILKGIKKAINKLYNSLKTKWNNNNFYIRYIFSCLTYVYIIISVLFLLNKLL